MTIRTELQANHSISDKELRSASYTFNIPFQLQLLEGQMLFAEKVVRIIPGKRMVVFGTWLGREVVAKLFFDPRHAKRHAQADAVGMKKLQLNKVPSPALFYEGQSKDKGISVLIYEKINDAIRLADAWEYGETTNEVLLF